MNFDRKSSRQPNCIRPVTELELQHGNITDFLTRTHLPDKLVRSLVRRGIITQDDIQKVVFSNPQEGN